jgi:hypothetical protein
MHRLCNMSRSWLVLLYCGTGRELFSLNLEAQAARGASITIAIQEDR